MLKKLSLILLLTVLHTACADNKGSVDQPIAEDAKQIPDLPQFPDKIKNKNELIPDGWSMLDMLEHDFNNDGLLDLVGVAEHPFAEDVMYPRTLLVYMNNGSGYNRNLMNQYLIRNSDEGGAMGDPYQEMTAQNNTFTTHSFGGSAWKWQENYTFEYKNEEWFLLVEENVFGYGPFETVYSYDDYKLGSGKRRYTEASPEKENAASLEFSVKLDKQPLLKDFAYSDFWGAERLKAPVIASIGYNEGVSQVEGEISPLKSDNILFQNQDHIIYKIQQSDQIVYLGVYDYAGKHLQIIAGYSTNENNGLHISNGISKIYKGRLYFLEEKTGTDGNDPEVVGVQLVSMNLDGSDKRVIFDAAKDNQTDYMTLDYEITGDEIIVEVFGGESYPYYRMNVDGGDRKLIGHLPRGSW